MRKLYSLGILFLFISCVSSKIISNKSPDFNEKIARLFIKVKGDDKAKPFLDAFAYHLRGHFKEKDIYSKTYYYGKLSLDSESDIKEKIAAYSPNLVLVINQTESKESLHFDYVGRTGYGAYLKNTGGTFDLQIFQPNSESPVWRGNLETEAYLGFEKSAKKASVKLIEKLIEDGLL